MDIKNLKKYTQNLKVLYAEDETLLRTSTTVLLNSFFDHVDAVADGSEAIALYKKHHEDTNLYYDIVITDLLMPKIDGYKLSKSILEFNPKQEIIVFSAQANFDNLIELLNIGVNKFIQKPIKIAEFSKVLYDVSMNIRRLKREQETLNELNEYNVILQDKTDDKIKAFEEFSNALNLSTIVAKTDTIGVITYVNQQFCDISGYTKEELIGHNNRILKGETRSSSFYKRLWNTINDKKSYKTMFVNKHKDGYLYYVETTINPIVDTHGNIVEFIAVSHDMTNLIKSIERTKKAEKSKEDFFVNISHEMKTPLNSILGFSSLLKKRVQDDKKALMMVETINETGNDLKTLVDSILDLSKIQNNSLTLNNMLFEPHIELTKCFNKYSEKALEKNQDFTTIIDSNIPKSLLGDNHRIIQIISIVLDNAIKFTPENGKIKTTVSYDIFSKILTCEIKDNGIGIAKENQEQIFGLEQLDASANRSFEGAGLGLSIAYSILKIMKGTISVKSIVNYGSLFTLEFPLEQN